MTFISADTFFAHIYLAGDIEIAKQVCREECFREGLCVTVAPCDYIYTGGQEAGYVVGLVNYPRFPKTPEEITARARALAVLLMERGYQHSCMVMLPGTTEWLSRREQ